MGIAASQARYIGLTARKTNTEYEGQQVNQERMALAEQSANTFNELLALQVPTAPSVSDYTTDSYEFTDGSTDYTLSNIQANPDPNYPYLVTLKYPSNEYQASNLNILKGSLISDNNNETTKGEYPYVMKYNGGQVELKKIDYETLQEDSSDKIAIDTINNKYALSKDSIYYSYKSGNNTYYITQNDLNSYNYDTTKNPMVEKPYDANAKLQTYFATNIETSEEKTYQAALFKDDAGRYSQVSLKDGSENGSTFSLDYTSVKDEQAYEAAMEQYTYKKDQYDKRIQEINAKTQKLQEEDRTLELRLKQLDTNQQAIQTEMESVAKVIDKAIDQVFKTFQS